MMNELKEYWQELIGFIGGIWVITRLMKLGRSVVTKEELTEHCSHQHEIIRGQIKIAVLEAMNEWLKTNGHRIK